jgi:hypothetical protein
MQAYRYFCRNSGSVEDKGEKPRKRFHEIAAEKGVSVTKATRKTTQHLLLAFGSPSTNTATQFSSGFTRPASFSLQSNYFHPIAT